MPPCQAENPDELHAAVLSALKSGDVEGAKELFEDLAVCRGDSALVIGSMYDPAQTMSGRPIEPDARKALHFYRYAAALGKVDEVWGRLSALKRSVQSDPELMREIADLAGALEHQQH